MAPQELTQGMVTGQTEIGNAFAYCRPAFSTYRARSSRRAKVPISRSPGAAATCLHMDGRPYGSIGLEHLAVASPASLTGGRPACR